MSGTVLSRSPHGHGNMSLPFSKALLLRVHAPVPERTRVRVLLRPYTTVCPYGRVSAFNTTLLFYFLVYTEKSPDFQLSLSFSSARSIFP